MELEARLKAVENNTVQLSKELIDLSDEKKRLQEYASAIKDLKSVCVRHNGMYICAYIYVYMCVYIYMCIILI